LPRFRKYEWHRNSISVSRAAAETENSHELFPMMSGYKKKFQAYSRYRRNDRDGHQPGCKVGTAARHISISCADYFITIGQVEYLQKQISIGR
jgi:hypothetical protein